MYTLMCAHPHNEGEQIDSLIGTLNNDLHNVRPHSTRISVLTNKNLNPFFSYDYVSSNGGMAFIWPTYAPSTSLDVTITDVRSIFKNHCSIVECEYADKSFYFFGPSPAKEYESALGRKKTLRLAAVAVDDLFIETKTEPLSSWFNREEYEQLQRNGYIQSTMARAISYEAIFQEVIGKDDRGDYLLLQAKNPIDQYSDIELLAWRYRNCGLPYAQQPPQEVGAEFYFIGTL